MDQKKENKLRLKPRSLGRLVVDLDELDLAGKRDSQGQWLR
jgi:hypothetical protein